MISSPSPTPVLNSNTPAFTNNNLCAYSIAIATAKMTNTTGDLSDAVKILFDTDSQRSCILDTVKRLLNPSSFKAENLIIQAFGIKENNFVRKVIL